jgi:hypothetical protein
MASNFLYWDKNYIEENIAWVKINTSKEKLNSLLNEIETEVESSSFEFNKLLEFSFEITQRIPLPLIQVDVPFLVRCRPNKKNQIFYNKSEISYNPDLNNINPGRFNLKREPLFYAVSPSQNEIDFPHDAAAMFETCKELREKDYQLTESRFFTLGYWKIIKPFMAISLSFFDEAEKKNSFIKMINTRFKSVYERKFTIESQEVQAILFKYLSEKSGLASTSDKDYLITTAFFHSFRKYYDSEIIAILFSSSMSDNYCMNVVLTKEAVDDGIIKLDSILMYKMFPSKEVFPFTKIAKPTSDGNFFFTHFDYQRSRNGK